jgi:hypothetical protein
MDFAWNILVVLKDSYSLFSHCVSVASITEQTFNPKETKIKELSNQNKPINPR